MTIPVFRIAPPPVAALTGVLAVLLALSGCVPRPSLDESGRIPVLSSNALSGQWVATGSKGTTGARFVSAEFEGVPAVRVDGGAEPAALVRPLDATLLVSPYLSWAWAMMPQGGAHPVHLRSGCAPSAWDSRARTCA
jgi:hypothetical protein